MSTVKIRAALESALNSINPPIQTAWENVPYNPTVGTPYQRITLLMAQPSNPTMGSKFYRELGMLYVTLCYPTDSGTSALMTRAELIKSVFIVGASFTNGGITAIVTGTPEIGTPAIEDERYFAPVKIRFYADIFL